MVPAHGASPAHQRRSHPHQGAEGPQAAQHHALIGRIGDGADHGQRTVGELVGQPRRFHVHGQGSGGGQLGPLARSDQMGRGHDGPGTDVDALLAEIVGDPLGTRKGPADAAVDGAHLGGHHQLADAEIGSQATGHAHQGNGPRGGQRRQPGPGCGRLGPAHAGEGHVAADGQ